MHHKVLEKIACNVFTRLAALLFVGSLGLGCTTVQFSPEAYREGAPRYFGGGINTSLGDSQGFAPAHSLQAEAKQPVSQVEQRWVF
jgi:hypothetical protein